MVSVARLLDGATPQRVQKMTLEGLLHFVARQQRLAREVFTCYESGAFGYRLHRHSWKSLFQPRRSVTAHCPGLEGEEGVKEPHF